MQVNFTGLKNTAYLSMQNPETNEGMYVLNTQLTDDKDGADLTKYKTFLNRINSNSKSSYRNEFNPNFVNFLIHTSDMGIDDITGKRKTLCNLYLNGKLFELKDERIPIFEFLAHLASKISAKPNNEFVVNKDYIEGEDCQNGILPFGNIKYMVEMNPNLNMSYEDFIKEIHSPQRVKDGAKEINEFFYKVMLDYFA